MTHYNQDYRYESVLKGPPKLRNGVRIPDVNRLIDESGALVVWMFGRKHPPHDRYLIEFSWDGPPVWKPVRELELAP